MTEITRASTAMQSADISRERMGLNDRVFYAYQRMLFSFSSPSHLNI